VLLWTSVGCWAFIVHIRWPSSEHRGGFEVVNRGGVDDMLSKTVPRTDDRLTEDVFLEVKTGSVEG